MKTLIAAALLLALAAPAHAEWYLTVDIYTHSNRGHTSWDSPTKMYLEHAFDSRHECLERARTFRKQCSGFIPDQNVGGAGVTKFISYCRRHSQQPEPVLKAWSAADVAWGDPNSPEWKAVFEYHEKCAK